MTDFGPWDRYILGLQIPFSPLARSFDSESPRDCTEQEGFGELVEWLGII